MLIKDKDMTSYQLFLKQDRVLVKQSTYFFDQWIWNFFFSFRKNGSVVRWETKHFIGMAWVESVLSLASKISLLKKLEVELSKTSILRISSKV